MRIATVPCPMPQVPSGLRRHLAQFADHVPLPQRIVHVLMALPHAVLRDFLSDARFRLALDDFSPQRGRTVRLAPPGPNGGGSRCVVLKPRLATCAEPFAHYVIAHELAHAWLRNGGWDAIADPEHAADALAAAWGFPRIPQT